MNFSFQTIKFPVENILLKEKGSKFIGFAFPVNNVKELKNALEKIREEHPKATHHCYAFRLGMNGENYRANDDGEPSGTAGRPMLDVLRHQDLEGVLATVVRYFGGVKLGAGGLVRAYTDTVAPALLQADKVPLQRMRTLECSVPYALEGLLRRMIDGAGVQLLQVQHATLVTLQLRLPEAEAEAFVHQVNEAGQGRVAWGESTD